MNWTINQTVDLSRGYTPVVWPDALMLFGDDLAHTWRVRVTDGGAPANLSGAVVTGYFVREDGVTVTVPGSVSGDTISVTLAQNCYAVPGRLGGVLRMVQGSKTVTISSVMFTVKGILTGEMVDPGAVFKDVSTLSRLYDALAAQVDALASGAPAGTYTSLAALTAANPDETRIYITTDNGHWNYWNGSAWVSGGAYQATQNPVYEAGIAANKDRLDAMDGLTLTTRNLVDIAKYLIPGHLTHNVSGGINPSAGYNAFAYIPVTPETDYYLSFAGNVTAAYVRYVWYNASKTFISGVLMNEGMFTIDETKANGKYVKITAPANAGFIGFSLRNVNELTNYGYAQLEAGTYTPYIGGGVWVKDERIIPRSVPAYLPSEICVAVGRTIEIYNSQVCPTRSDLVYEWECPVGKGMARKYTITGEAPGNHTLSLYIHDWTGEVLWSGQTIIKVVSGLSTNNKLLTIGDSLTNGKPWLSELTRLSGGSITHVGTRPYTNIPDSEGTQRSGFHEGRSGWSAYRYNGAFGYDTAPVEVLHPFYDSANARFNWAHYKSTTGVNPDAVQIFLGINGMQLDPTSAMTNLKKMVDYIRQDDATIPIFIVMTPYRGDQNGLGTQYNVDGYVTTHTYKLQDDLKVYANMTAIVETFGAGYTNVHFVPLALCHDSAYNYGGIETQVNPRNPATELIAPDATHPQDAGYWQYADVMYSVLSAHL